MKYSLLFGGSNQFSDGSFWNLKLWIFEDTLLDRMPTRVDSLSCGSTYLARHDNAVL